MAETSSEDTLDFFPPEDPKSRFFGPPSTAVEVDVGAVSDVGNVRSNNEDHFAVVRRRRSRTVLLSNLPKSDLQDVDEDAYALVVADGMGGEVFGELASRLAIRTAGELGVSEIKWALKMNDAEAREMVEKLETYAHLLHEELIRQGEDDPQLQGMGTTLTAAYSTGVNAFLAHIGDSRAFLFRNGQLQRLTRDHTLAQEMLDAGADDLSASQIRWMSRVLTNSLSTRKQPLHTDVIQIRLQDQDRLMLCTDGLSDLVTEDQMALVLSEKISSQEASEKLVNLALEAGGNDNVTVIVAHYRVAGS